MKELTISQQVIVKEYQYYKVKESRLSKDYPNEKYPKLQNLFLKMVIRKICNKKIFAKFY